MNPVRNLYNTSRYTARITREQTAICNNKFCKEF